jgi:hypothetical protein
MLQFLSQDRKSLSHVTIFESRSQKFVICYNFCKSLSHVTIFGLGLQKIVTRDNIQGRQAKIATRGHNGGMTARGRRWQGLTGIHTMRVAERCKGKGAPLGEIYRPQTGPGVSRPLFRVLI